MPEDIKFEMYVALIKLLKSVNIVKKYRKW